MPDPTRPGARRGARLLAKLSEPVDAPRPAPAAAEPAPRPTALPGRDAAARSAQRSADLYARKLRAAQASGEPTRVLMAHVDRIRALRQPALTRAAISALAALIDRHTRTGHGHAGAVNSPPP